MIGLNTKTAEEIKQCYINLEEIYHDYSKSINGYNNKSNKLQLNIQEKEKEEDISELEESFNNQLKIKEEQLNNLELSNKNMNNFVNKVKIHEKNGYIYIATSKKYAEKNSFKIGRTDNLKNRLSQFNTSRNLQDLFYFCYHEQVYDVNKVENLIHTLLENFREKKSKEIFVIHYTYLIELITLVVKNVNEPFECINDLMKNKLDEMYNLKSFIPKPLTLNKNK